MTDVELKMVFNDQTEEVEVLVDGEVLMASGVEEFKSWAEWHADKHKPEVVEPSVPVADGTITGVVPEPVVPPAEPVVDKPEEV